MIVVLEIGRQPHTLLDLDGRRFHVPRNVDAAELQRGRVGHLHRRHRVPFGLAHVARHGQHRLAQRVKRVAHALKGVGANGYARWTGLKLVRLIAARHGPVRKFRRHHLRRIHRGEQPTRFREAEPFLEMLLRPFDGGVRTFRAHDGDRLAAVQPDKRVRLHRHRDRKRLHVRRKRHARSVPAVSANLEHRKITGGDRERELAALDLHVPARHQLRDRRHGGLRKFHLHHGILGMVEGLERVGELAYALVVEHPEPPTVLRLVRAKLAIARDDKREEVALERFKRALD